MDDIVKDLINSFICEIIYKGRQRELCDTYTNMDQKLAKELINTRRAVKQKFLALKSDQAQYQSQLEKQLKPISEPLKQVLKQVTQPETEQFFKKEHDSLFLTPKKVKDLSFKSSPLQENLRQEPIQNLYNEYLPQTGLSFLEDTYSNIPNYSKIQDISTTEEYSPNVTVTDRDNELLERTRQEIQDMLNTPAYNEYIEMYHPLPRQYIDESIRGNEDTFDRHYGLSHNVLTEKFTLGNTDVNFEGQDIIVNNLKYPGTVGLYELLFKKEPIGYTEKDLDQYMDILKRTNAYRRNFDHNAQIQGTRATKYETVIKPYLLKHKILKYPSTINEGVQFDKPPPPSSRLRKTKRIIGGMMSFSKKPVNYIYFDDYNEIVNRLRLLVASQLSGNDGHNNEIISIIEELKEANIIK